MQNKNFRKEILRLMLPIAFQNLMTTLVSATDALVLARVDQFRSSEKGDDIICTVLLKWKWRKKAS